MQTAIISAAASGIGLAIARGLNADGWRVYVCDSDEAALAALAQAGPGLTAFPCDVSDAGAVDGFYRAVEKDLARAGPGGIDLLVNNAGVSGPTARFEEQPVADWQRTIDVNINGMFLMTRAAIPLLRAKAPGSSIITMSSNAGLLGCPLRGPYVASKWALIGLTKTLAMELGPEGIRANALCPASVEGPRIDRVIAADAQARGLSVAEVESEYKRQSSLRAFATNDDIVGMVRFLASPAGQRISGQAIAIDGHTESLSLDMDSQGAAGVFRKAP
ncbi:SDR family oxidoreductase [Novosphingobium sp. Chol11]|uniref:SDR family oxidoreductase n=1 Tax=Novosphingobium sp. Chol11 TaxID=1385763 RepID=UPI0025E177BA|nr:SDR family oxidoreductase [Novosphingobium sp. Chol11]